MYIIYPPTSHRVPVCWFTSTIQLWVPILQTAISHYCNIMQSQIAVCLYLKKTPSLFALSWRARTSHRPQLEPQATNLPRCKPVKTHSISVCRHPYASMCDHVQPSVTAHATSSNPGRSGPDRRTAGPVRSGPAENSPNRPPAVRRSGPDRLTPWLTMNK